MDKRSGLYWGFMSWVSVIFLVVSLPGGPCHAQDLARLSGMVVDSSNHEGLPGATAILISRSDTSQKQGTNTDASGAFSFNVPKGLYLLRVTFIGYRIWQQSLTLGEDKALPPINLSARTEELKGVDVTGHVQVSVQKQDTTVLKAAAFKTAQDANAQTLIEKMPGIQVQDGKVQAQGEDVQQVLVDGKPFLGDDPNAALQNLPAQMIDKVEIFDQQSDQAKFTGFDDGNTKKTLNLVTKTEFRDGTFGKMTAMGGSDSRYATGGNINFFNGKRRISILAQSNNINQQNFTPDDLAGVMSGSGGGSNGGHGRPGGVSRRYGRGGGASANVSDFLVPQTGGITHTNAIGLNYSDTWGKKLQVDASYFFNKSNNHTESKIFRQYITSNDTSLNYSEDDLNNSINTNHRFNLRLEYKANARNSLLLTSSGVFQGNNGDALQTAVTQLNQSIENNALTHNNTNLNSWNFQNDLLLRHRFSKPGRTLTLDLQQGYNSQTGNRSLLSQSLGAGGVVLDSLNQFAQLRQFGHTWSGNLTYTQALSEHILGQINYRAGINLDNSDKRTFNYFPSQADYTLLDTSLSNTFSSRYPTQQIGTGIRIHTKKTRMAIQADLQRSDLQANRIYPYETSLSRTYWQVLPHAFARFSLADTKNLVVAYRTSADAPSITQLQDVVDNTNPLQLTAGNPDLAPQYQHRLFVRYRSANNTRNTSFFTFIGGTYSANYIGNSTYYATRDTNISGVDLAPGGQYVKPVNLSGYANLRVVANYGVPWYKLRCNANIFGMVNWTRSPGELNGKINYNSNPQFSLGGTLSSNISDKVDFTLSSRGQYSLSNNTLESNLNTAYFNLQSSLRLYWNFYKSLVFRSDVTQQWNSGLSASYNTNYYLWNLSLGCKIFKNKRGEISASVFDLLNQNQDISRTVTDTYIEDDQTLTLKRYVSLSFSYNLRSFKQQQ